MDRRALEQHFDANVRRYLDEWQEFLRFPTVSADPARHQDCLDCAHWLTRHLAAMGLDAKLLETPSKPVVYAEHKGRPGKPRVLFYGHYDVQPADPLDQWTSPPFEPAERDGRIYARGAEDNKGQVMFVLKALETLIHAASLELNVKVVLEGEEESGSRGMAGRLPKWRRLLRSDVLMVCDTGMAQSGAPTIIMGLRGVIWLTATLRGAHHDLHSGVHGGAAPNAAQEMARLLASLHRADGSIAVEGYYDDVPDITARERALAAEAGFDPAAYERETGVPPVAGEPGLPPELRIGFRPTVELNGVHSGYGGAGGKTVIPAEAVAKISSRLVAGQDPARCMDALVRHLERHAPRGLKLEISEKSLSGPGLKLNPDSPLSAKARAVLGQLSDKPVVFLWEGASIPVVAALARESGAEPLLVGFGMDEDRIHAPNESFPLERFKLGYLYAGLLLSSL